MNIYPNYDIHTHTNLSACGSQTHAFPYMHIEWAERVGLEILGLADHSWDMAVCVPSSWYIAQTYERLEKRRTDLDEYYEKRGYGPKLKVLFGAEGEFADGVLGLGRAAAERLDYVIIPHSHTHLRGFVMPESITDPKQHADYLIRSFYNLCTHPDRELFFGIAHPMTPVGKTPAETEELFSYMSDRALEECLCAAKENGIFLELNASVLNRFDYEAIGDSCYARLFKLMKKVGNKLFFGSDKHKVIMPGEADFFNKMPGYMEAFGLEKEDFTDAYRALLKKG